MGRPLASTRNSPSIPATRGPSPGGSRRYSQFPVDPRYAGPLAGRLAPLTGHPGRVRIDKLGDLARQ
ncbi:MAG TPA: hypothetical protein VGT81_06500, partial [Casimicrobiaceae bacterium]|nr:hypothetical protein [Casimicrobiaceae bacterium]